MYNRLFSDRDVNRGRQVELDIAKGLAVLFMVMVHVMIVFSTLETHLSPTGAIVEFLGTPTAAPVFMFLLGLFIVYSRKNDPRTLIKRGLTLILAGYLLNIFRSVLPALIQYATLGGNQYLTAAAETFIYVDILQFAGLAFIFFGIVRKYELKTMTTLVLGLAISMTSFLVVDLRTDDLLTAAVTGLFWGSNDGSFFPFVSWILVPVSGYVFGEYLIRCKDKDLFYRSSLIVSSLAVIFCVFVLMIAMGVDIGITDDAPYYHQNPVVNVIYISFAIYWMCVLYYVSKVLPRLVTNTISRWSRNVTEIYIIHFILVGWLGMLIGWNTQGLTSYFLLFISIFIASDAIAFWYLKRKRTKGRKKMDNAPPSTGHMPADSYEHDRSAAH